MIAMRHMTRALVSVLLILVIHDAAAAEEASRFGWWPFGRKASQPAANAGASMAVAAAAAPDAAQPKDRSLNRYPEFAEYRRRSKMFVPFLY
jgi:hypothetical protein